MRRFENQTLETKDCLASRRLKKGRSDQATSRAVVIEDLEFIKCKFTDCLLTRGSAKRHLTVRNVRISDSAAMAFSGYGVVFDELVIDGLRTSYAPMFLWGCVFRHVVIKGHVGQILLRNDVEFVPDHPRNDEFKRANEEYYFGVLPKEDNLTVYGYRFARADYR